MMSKVLFVALLGLAVASAAVFTESEYQTMFTSFMNKYNKKYSADSFFYRYTVFKANMDKIALANKQNHTYKLGMNAMGDMTHAEFKATKLGLNPVQRPFARALAACPVGPVPASVDWVAKGKVSPIKDQGQCGSCWSFSATGSIESALAIATNQPATVTLSEQQLVDCSGSYGNQGCNGGLMDSAFEYVHANGGLTTEAGYPYTAMDGNCNVETPLVATVGGYCDVTANNEKALEAAIAVGPVSVAIEADQACFQFYSSGVMSDKSCGTQLDHGVLAVGYGVVNGQKYYNVKNSWGTSWGAKGYIWLGREVAGQSSGVCGIAMMASYPTKVTAVGSKH